MLTDHDKQATGNRGSAHTEDEMNEEDPTQGILDWLQPFTVNPEDLETHVLADSSARENSDSQGDASNVSPHKNGSTVFMLTSAKTKRDLFCEQKSMVT